MLTERYKNCFIFLMFCYLNLKKIENCPIITHLPLIKILIIKKKFLFKLKEKTFLIKVCKPNFKRIISYKIK